MNNDCPCPVLATLSGSCLLKERSSCAWLFFPLWSRKSGRSSPPLPLQHHNPNTSLIVAAEPATAAGADTTELLLSLLVELLIPQHPDYRTPSNRSLMSGTIASNLGSIWFKLGSEEISVEIPAFSTHTWRCIFRRSGAEQTCPCSYCLIRISLYSSSLLSSPSNLPLIR